MVAEILNSVEDLREIEGVSYSSLSKIAESPQAYKRYLDKEIDSVSITLGDVVDTLVTQPERFNDKFIVSTTEMPSSDMMLKFCQALVDGKTQEEAYAISGFKITLNHVLNKYAKEGEKYVQEVIEAKKHNKKIISFDLYTQANQLNNQIRDRTNRFVSHLFAGPVDDNIERRYQVPALWNMNIQELPFREKTKTISFRGVLDIMLINHNTKTVTPYELKTGGEGFFRSYWRFKRYLQGSMYSEFIETWTRLNLPDYKPQNTIFVYLDTNMQKPPMQYQMTHKDVLISMVGEKYKDILTGEDLPIYKVKGFIRLAEELDWHKRNNQWDYSYDEFINNGVMPIDSFTRKI